MSDLLPCPFCGGQVALAWNKKEVVCLKCEALGPFCDTEAEAIAAWNTRVDYHGYEQAAIEAWESIKAWNSRAERTCKVISHKTFCGAGGCEEAGELWTLSCGHEVMNDSDFPPNFCDECGCKVIGG